MDHFLQIYNAKAKQYHQMIAAEDIENNILTSLEEITSFDGKRVLDLGSGTGRLPLLLTKQNIQIAALDLHQAMLIEQASQRDDIDGKWDLLQGDMHCLPFPNEWAEVVLAGWALGHFVGWYEQNWRQRVEQVINEMQRVLSPGGTIIILETLGTGSLKPAPPHDGLAQYYDLLEKKFEFNRNEISTDYRFETISQAIEKSEFFFGPDLTEKIQANQWTRIPEWTGIWSKQDDSYS